MADFNRTIMAGRLTFDPELRHIPSGKSVTELRMVTNKRWKSESGEKMEKAVYYDVTVWGVQADNCCKYLKRGSQALIEGSLDMDEWEDKASGQKRTKLKVVADNVVFLDSKPREGGDNGGYQERRAESPAPRSAPPAGRGGAPAPRQAPTATYTQQEVDDLDVPF